MDSICGEEDMIELWQLVIIGLVIWCLYSLTSSPINPRSSNQELKRLVNEEIGLGISREKQLRIRLGLEPVITTHHCTLQCTTDGITDEERMRDA